jgi:hypothetical protein
MLTSVIDSCDQCEIGSSDCWRDAPRCGKDIIECPHCTGRFDYDDLQAKDPAKIVTIREPRPWGSTVAYEQIVVGCYCPFCGHKIDF